MKHFFTYFILLFSLAVLHGNVFGQTFNTEWIKYNGPASNKVDIAVVGDGYTSYEQTKFISDVNTAINGMFQAAPFYSIANDYNVKAIKVISNVSGAASNPSALIDNYFGSTFGYSGIDRLLVPTNSQRITSVINSNYPEADVVVVIVNSSKYGGSGGQYCTLSTNSASVDLLIHEFGHTFGGLADEYWAGSQYAMEKPNMTANSNPSTIKWKEFLYQQGVGIYPYEESPSWYRPHQSCEMRYLGQSFCLVCQDRLIDVTSSITGGNTGNVPPIPTGLSSTNITATSFTAEWNAASGATSYTVQKWNNSAWAEAGTTANTYLNLSGFTSGSTQYIRVKASNSEGSSNYSDYITVQLNNTVAIPPVPTGLSSANVTATSFTSQWNAASGAISYTVQKWYNNAWTEAGTTANTYLNLSGFTSGSTQYIRVKASNSAGSSNYSSYITVQLSNNSSTPPSTPSGLSTTNVTSSSFRAQWNASSGATSYTVQKWYYGAWTEAGTTSNTYLDLSGFTSGSTQYIRVKASNSAGSSGYSSWIAVYLSSPPPISKLMNNHLLYPNPTAEIVSLNINENCIKIDFYSLQGKLLKTEILNGKKKINISDLSSGIYLVKIKTEERILHAKLIKK